MNATTQAFMEETRRKNECAAMPPVQIQEEKASPLVCLLVGGLLLVLSWAALVGFAAVLVWVAGFFGR